MPWITVLLPSAKGAPAFRKRGWIAIAILVILLIALNNHIVGYDNFIGIPSEWVRSLFD